VAGEVLALEMAPGRPEWAVTPHIEEELGLTFWIQKA
jgi:hypothetical protein